MLGWRHALEGGATRIVQIDAGGSHDPADIPTLLSSTADLVVGSRFCPGGRHVGNPRRALLSRVAAGACSFAQTGARYADWTSGYRVLSARCARYLLSVPYRATMHGWQIETLARAGEAGFSIEERPITYTAGRSSLNRAVAWEAFLVWNDILNHIGWVGSRLREEGLS
jgi:dolichol-phosphate mannosyltransferase